MKNTNHFYQKLQAKYSRKIDLDLERINRVLFKLNFPHLHINQPINIIGSSGKFSTLTCLKYFFAANKKKVSTFISPHLYDLRERFEFNGKTLSLAEIKKYQSQIEKTKIKLTLFELITLIQVLACKDKKMDINLFEAGLFFRGDSTRLWKMPAAQIITNINLQHKDWLAKKTIKQICYEKCAFLSANTKIFIGKQTPSTLRLIKQNLKNNPSKVFYPSNWQIKSKQNKIYYSDPKNSITIKNNNIVSQGLLHNLGLAIHVALNFGVSKKIIQKTAAKIIFPGRLHNITKGKLRKLVQPNTQLILDGCHAPAEGENLSRYLRTLKQPIYGVWGMLKNKEPEHFIKKFRGIFKTIIPVSISGEPSACSTKELKKILFKNKFQIGTANNFKSALTTLAKKPTGTIVVFGSLYLVGEVLSKN